MQLTTDISVYQCENHGEDMGLSLRIDIDNPFGYATFFRKVLNKVSLDFNLIPRWSSLGYLDNAKALRDYLAGNGVPATWFFRNETTPGRRDISTFSRAPFDLALHAERTDTFENFAAEVRKWTRAMGARPTGFSKHGSGDRKLSRKHVMEYDAEAFIGFGNRAGFEYFSGNGTEYNQGFQNRGGLVYIPSVFWLDNPTLHTPGTTLDSVVEFSRENAVVVLVHPIWWGTQLEVRAQLESLIRKTELQGMREQVRHFRETSASP